MAHYIDTSALAKLVVAESETSALRTWLSNADRQPVSSDLARVELLRAVRCTAPDRILQARAVLDVMTLLQMTSDIVEAAGRLEPTTLRTLDAIHLSTALSLGDEVESIVTYDERLARAAEAYAIPVIAPH